MTLGIRVAPIVDGRVSRVHAKAGRSDPVVAVKAIRVRSGFCNFPRASPKFWLMDVPVAMIPDKFASCLARSSSRG